MIKISKIKAGALQLVLFISVVIAVLLGAFVLVLHTHKMFKTQTTFTLQAIENTNKGVQQLLNQKAYSTDTVTIVSNEFKTIKGCVNYWGMYKKLYVNATIKNKQFSKIALVGGKENSLKKTALFLEEHYKPLVIVGNAKIEGKSFLPTNGIKTGNIGGHSYYRSKLIYGTTQLSGTLPKIYQKHLTYIKQLTKINNRLSDDKFLNIYSKNKFKNSFKKSTQIIYEKSTINLTNKTIIGNILIQSESKIIVDQTSNLTDVILLAPIIEIKNNVKGVFQAIASKKIIVGNHCNLLYPSALVVQENSNVFLKDASEKQPKIFVKEHCTIGGLVGYLGNIKNHNPQIYISSNVTIKGEIYCKQNLDLRGTVYGTVYTANFVAQQNGSSYQNHLYNGQIIANSLANKYAGLDFKNHINNVVQWLY